MASLIISSAAVTSMSRATSSQARQVVVPVNGTKLSNYAVTQNHASSLVAAPFTGLKSNSTFPMTRKVDNIASLSSNGGRAKCLVKDGPLQIKKANDSSWVSGSTGTIEFTGGDLTNWVEVDVEELSRGRTYEVIYYVRMKSSPIENYLTLTTTDPDGSDSVVTKKYTVTQGSWVGIPFEPFRQTFGSGKIKFTFDSSTPAAWVGLIIEEAIISPVD